MLRHIHVQYYWILCHSQTSANIAFDMARPRFHQFRADASWWWIFFYFLSFIYFFPFFLIMACQSDSKLHIGGRQIRQRMYRGKSSNISSEFRVSRKQTPTQSDVSALKGLCTNMQMIHEAHIHTNH